MVTEEKSSGSVEVDVQTTNGIRHGVIKDGLIYGTFPSQSMTTTNINYMNTVGRHDINFGTCFLDIPFKKDFSLLADSYKNAQAIAAKHAKSKMHHVIFELGISGFYNGRKS